MLSVGKCVMQLIVLDATEVVLSHDQVQPHTFLCTLLANFHIGNATTLKTPYRRSGGLLPSPTQTV